MTTLPGPWRFHAGDNPTWSSTTFDDSVIRPAPIAGEASIVLLFFYWLDFALKTVRLELTVTVKTSGRGPCKLRR